MKRRWKILLVLGGYVAAVLIAAVVLAIRLAMTSGPDAQAMSGMYAFGDASLFLAVWFIAALVPTGAALYFLRAHRVLWIVLAVLAVVVAMTGVAAAAVYVAARDAGPHSSVVAWAGATPLRILAAQRHRGGTSGSTLSCSTDEASPRWPGLTARAPSSDMFVRRHGFDATTASRALVRAAIATRTYVWHTIAQS